MLISTCQYDIKILEEELLELKNLVNSSRIKPLEKAYLTVNEVSAQTGLNRQAIEKHRDKGTLSELGYHADKVGSKWRYYQTF